MDDDFVPRVRRYPCKNVDGISVSVNATSFSEARRKALDALNEIYAQRGQTPPTNHHLMMAKRTYRNPDESKTLEETWA